MPRVELTGASLAFEIAGQGEPLVLISGLNGAGSFWRAQLAAFSAHFQTITFDHRGIGASTGQPPYSIEQWAQDVVDLLDHLHIAVAHVVGHSTGGVVAQALAADFPQRVASIVLGATWAEPDDRFRRLFELRRDVLTALGRESFLRLGTFLTAPPDEPPTLISAEQTDASIIQARIDALLSYQGRARLPRIRCPALVIAAADDMLVPLHLSRAVADGIAGAQMQVLPSGSHAFPRSRALDYNRIVLVFLRSRAHQERLGLHSAFSSS